MPFENDTMLTINSPIWVDGSQEGPAAQAARHRRAQRRDPAQRRLRRGRDRQVARVRRGGVRQQAMPTYRLHYFPESGNSYKLALMLTLCGQTLRAGVDRFRRRRDAHAGMAARRQRDGRNSGARGGRRAPDPDRADPAASWQSNSAGSAARPSRSSSNCCAGCSGTTTSSPATWRPIAIIRAFTPSPNEHVLKHFRRRLDDFLAILERIMQNECIRHRRRGRRWPIFR